MTIILNPGFSGYVAVESEQGELFRQPIQSPQEAQTFIENYGQSVPGCSVLKASLIPLRTATWNELKQDLFLPTFINHACKVDSFVGKFFALALDVLTFIPRLIALPFRVRYNQQHTSMHPLVELIKDKPGSEQAIEASIVKIKVVFENVRIQADPILNLRTAKTSSVDGYQKVWIKALPGIKAESMFKTRTSICWEINGEWDVQSSITGNSSSLSSAL